MRWAQYLQGQGKNIQTVIYPKNGHALDGIEAEKCGYEKYSQFLAQYLLDKIL